jgi:hypothetical protein
MCNTGVLCRLWNDLTYPSPTPSPMTSPTPSPPPTGESRPRNVPARPAFGACVCARVRVCVRVCACVCACVRVRVHVRVRARVRMHMRVVSAKDARCRDRKTACSLADTRCRPRFARACTCTCVHPRLIHACKRVRASKIDARVLWGAGNGCNHQTPPQQLWRSQQVPREHRIRSRGCQPTSSSTL